jgi:hypothetical protein
MTRQIANAGQMAPWESGDDLLPDDAPAFWTARGFTRICTGGNCYAWERTLQSEGFHPVQILVTSNDDQETRSTGETHNVGLYLFGQGESYAFEYFQGAAQAWEWIREQLAMPERA